MKLNPDISPQRFSQKRFENLLGAIEQSIVIEHYMLDAKTIQKLALCEGTVEGPRTKIRINLRHRTTGAAKRTAIGELEHAGAQSRIKIPERHAALIGFHLEKTP